MLKNNVLAKYVVVASPNFSETFELDESIESFLNQYDLWDDVELAVEAKILTDKERHALRMQEQRREPGKVLTDKERLAQQNKSGGGGKILTDKERQQQNAGGGGGGGKVMTDKERLQQQQQGKQPIRDNKAAPLKPASELPSAKKGFPLDSTLRLKEEVQHDLARTYEIFIDRTDIDEGYRIVKESITKEVNDIIKKVAKKLKMEPRGIKVDVDFDERYDYTSGTITISYKGEEEEIQPSSLSYHDDGDSFAEDMGSWHWVAWLGHDDSPFHNSSWVEAYKEHDVVNVFKEIGSIENEADEVEEKVLKLLGGYSVEEQKKRRRG